MWIEVSTAVCPRSRDPFCIGYHWSRLFGHTVLHLNKGNVKNGEFIKYCIPIGCVCLYWVSQKYAHTISTIAAKKICKNKISPQLIISVNDGGGWKNIIFFKFFAVIRRVIFSDKKISIPSDTVKPVDAGSRSGLNI